MENNKRGPHLHHTLRKDLIKDILIWSGIFFSILGVAFILTLNSLVDYMLSEMANNRMHYQTVEFAKHLDESDQKSINEESHALVQGEALSGMIVIDASGRIAHLSLQKGEPPSLGISPEMTATKMREIVHSISYLRLYEAPIPGHQAILAIIMDKRPVLKAIYTSTLWTALLLFSLVGVSLLALRYSLKRHLITPIDEMRHIIDDDLPVKEKQGIMNHLPDEVVSLAHSYEDQHKFQEQAEERLRNSAFFLKETQRVANLGTYTLTISTGEWSSSDILDEIFGIDDSYMKNISGWTDLIHPDDREALHAYLTDNVLLNHEFFNREYRIIRHNDHVERWVHGLGKLEFNANNNPVKMVGTIQDITDRKQLELQLNQAQKMEALGTLVGGIAHDFNNMLAGMTGNLYLAKKKTKDMPDVMLKLANIERLSFRAADMIQQLLAFARKGQVNMRPLPLIPFIKEILKLLRTSLPENIVLHHGICKDNLLINADGTQLHQVIMNLVNNARDAVEGVEHPCINVRLEAFKTDDLFMKSHTYFKAGHYAHLSFVDNGCGIPEEQIQHLFEPFFTTKEVNKGTGLGLAMVFGAIKTHHGYVEVESAPGKGSTFHIYLPLIEEGETAVTPEASQQTIEGNGETILIVDDDAVIRSVGREVLEYMNYRVLEAVNGMEAIDTFTTHQNEVALIIMDLVMPRLGGVKAAERIRKINPDIKIVFATGYDKESTLPDAMPTIGSLVLSKPFNIEELSKTIRNQLDS